MEYEEYVYTRLICLQLAHAVHMEIGANEGTVTDSIMDTAQEFLKFVSFGTVPPELDDQPE